MELTAKTSETFIRRLASAPNNELDAIAKGCNAAARDPAQTQEVAFISRRLGILVRAILSQRA